eukprot:TRINITY_DN93028_c0_g1_i1.p1 TRINITY_DN93028_c0_g1~~TRINITY_DN93028_c0_g1_i1.p1  ORF type:complete len:543 (-),score=73.26 TRINITY_DN93028_c0_g1_i1:60-1688(-)
MKIVTALLAVAWCLPKGDAARVAKAADQSGERELGKRELGERELGERELDLELAVDHPVSSMDEAKFAQLAANDATELVNLVVPENWKKPVKHPERWKKGLGVVNTLAGLAVSSGALMTLSGVGAVAGLPVMLAGCTLKVITGTISAFIAPKSNSSSKDAMIKDVRDSIFARFDESETLADSVQRVENKLDVISARLDALLKSSSRILNTLNLQTEDKFFDRADTMHYYFLKYIVDDNSEGLKTYLQQQMPAFIESTEEVFSPVHARWMDHLTALLADESGQSVLRRHARLLTTRIQSFDLVWYYYLVVQDDEDMALNHLEQFHTDLKFLADAKVKTISQCLHGVWENHRRLDTFQLTTARMLDDDIITANFEDVMGSAFDKVFTRGGFEELMRVAKPMMHLHWQSEDGGVGVQTDRIYLYLPGIMHDYATNRTGERSTKDFLQYFRAHPMVRKMLLACKVGYENWIPDACEQNAAVMDHYICRKGFPCSEPKWFQKQKDRVRGQIDQSLFVIMRDFYMNMLDIVARKAEARLRDIQSSCSG